MRSASRWCLRSLVPVAVAWIVACGGGGETDSTPTSEATSSASATAEVTSTAATQPTAPTTPAVIAGPAVEAALVEIVDAVRTAEGVLDALDRADEEGVWDPVTAACQPYPALPPSPGSSLATTSGLWTEAQQPALWPTPIVELDQTTATACFLVAAAREIPPDARIDDEAPTTAEIVARPIETALQAIEARDETALRLLIEEHS